MPGNTVKNDYAFASTIENRFYKGKCWCQETEEGFKTTKKPLEKRIQLIFILYYFQEDGTILEKNGGQQEIIYNIIPLIILEEL